MELLPFQDSNCSLFSSKPAKSSELGLMSAQNELMKDISEHKEKEMTQGWQDIMDLGDDFMDISSFDYLKDEVLLSLDELPPDPPMASDSGTPTAAVDSSGVSAAFTACSSVPAPLDTSVANHVTAPVANHVTTPMENHVTAPMANHVTAPVANHVTAPMTNHMTAPMANHVTAPMENHVTAPVANHVTAPVAVAVSDSMTTPVTTNMIAPVTNSATLVNTHVTTPVITPMSAPVAAPMAAPDNAPTTTPTIPPVDVPMSSSILPDTTQTPVSMATSVSCHPASSNSASDIPATPSRTEIPLASSMDPPSELSFPETSEITSSPVRNTCNASSQPEPMQEDDTMQKDVSSAYTSNESPEHSPVSCKTSDSLHRDDSSTSQQTHVPRPMLPWTVTSFWVSPDVRLKECSVRVERVAWPAERSETMSDGDEEMESDDVGRGDEEEEDEEEEEGPEEESGEEEWMILKAETSKDCQTSDAVTSSCLTRLLLKKCRHNSSSNESHESSSKTTEKTLMLDAYHNQDTDNTDNTDSKTLTEHDNIEPAKSEPDSSNVSTTSSSETLAQPSFSKMLEQCLKRSQANQSKHQLQNTPEPDSMNVRLLPCSLCTKTFADIDALCHHIRHHPPLESSPPKLPLLGFRCPLCWEKFPLRSLLVGHMLYTCQTSYKQPELKGLVKATEMYFCENCLQGFPSLTIASGHAKYTCKPRKKGHDYSDLDDEQVIIAHLFEKSPNVSKSRLLRVEEFRCPQCRLRFPTAAIAECHLRFTCVFNILDIIL